MVAPRPRRVRGLDAIWPRGSKYSPRREKAANKEKAAQARQVKDGEKIFKNHPPTPFQKRFYTKSLLDGCWQDAPRDVQGLASRPVRRRKSGRPYTARRRWFPVSDHWGFGPFRFPTCQYPEAFETCRQLTTELTPRRARNFTPGTTKKIKKNAYFKRLKRFSRPL